MTRRTATNEELAASAFKILNDLMGEIHAGGIVGILAVKRKFPTKWHSYFIRLGSGGIFIALYKFDDLWNAQLMNLLADDVPSEGKELSDEIKRRKIRQFRSLFVAHYSAHKKLPKPPLEKLESLLHKQGFKTEEELYLWTKKVIKQLQAVRDAILARYPQITQRLPRLSPKN